MGNACPAFGTMGRMGAYGDQTVQCVDPLGREHLAGWSLEKHRLVERNDVIRVMEHCRKVVRDPEHTELRVVGERIEQLAKQVGPAGVHAGSRLIQEQDVGLVAQCHRDEHAFQFPAGECAKSRVSEFRGSGLSQCLHGLGDEGPMTAKPHGTPLIGEAEEIENRDWSVPVEDDLLRDQADTMPPSAGSGVPAEGYRALVGHLTGDGCNQRGLPGSVRTDKGSHTPAPQARSDVNEYACLSKGDIEAFDLDRCFHGLDLSLKALHGVLSPMPQRWPGPGPDRLEGLADRWSGCQR